MKKYFYSIIAIVILSFVFQACVPQQLEVNPGFGKKGSEISAARAAPISQQTKAPPISKLAEGPEAQKPIWKVGYKWEYEWENPETGSSGTITRRIIREDAFDGIPCFVIKYGRTEGFFTKDVLGFLASKRKGRVITKRDAPDQPLAWPLKVGKQWNNVYTREKPQEESSSNFDLQVVVAKLEEVTVPAGMFKAFKIEVYYSHTGNLSSEWWYSPEVEWFVKWIRYGSSPREERLKSYKIDVTAHTATREQVVERIGGGEIIGQHYIHERKGYKIALPPEEWYPRSTSVLDVRFNHEAGGGSIGTGAYTRVRTSFTDVSNRWVGAMTRKFDWTDVKILEERDLTLAGHSARVLTVEYTSRRGTSRTTRIYHIFKPGGRYILYRLRLWCAKERYEEVLPTFEKLVKSFSFL